MSRLRQRTALLALGACVACGGGGELRRPEPRNAPTTPPAAQSETDRPPPSSAPPVPPEANLGVRDVGVFSDLDARVQLALPPGLERGRVTAAVDSARQQLVLYDGGWPLKVYPLGGSDALQVGAVQLKLRPGDRAELAPLLDARLLYRFERRVELPPGDADDDGIPDPLDVRIGAHKVLLNADHYDGRYVALTYPMGDPPRSIGVCTDVVVRALRNAGYDLQRAVAQDIAAAPRAYPMIKRPNPSIDHRRVKTLVPFLRRHHERHAAAWSDAADPFRPGDVLLMDTFPDRPGADHIGLVADRDAEPGRPLVVNNWTDGTVSSMMDLLAFVPVTERFRLPARLVERGPIGALRAQLLTVIAEQWSDRKAVLRRYEREPGGAWRAIGTAVPVVIGHAGYGWGDGLHGSGAPAGRQGPLKREGDGRSPAGAFELGTAHGYAPTMPLRIAYQQATTEVCVDDPASAHYNQIFALETRRRDFRSFEQMRRPDALYALAIVVEHNRATVTPQHGSCIFLHVWSGPDSVVTGCTAMALPDLDALARWLEPNAAVLVSLPRAEYAALRPAWGLP